MKHLGRKNPQTIRAQMNRRSFFKSLALLAAAPRLFEPLGPGALAAEVDSIGASAVEMTTTWRKAITQAMSGFGITQELSFLTFVQGANPGLDVDQEVPEKEVKGPMNNMVRAFFHRCAGRSMQSLSTGPHTG
jgi:hypothetical protein